MEVNIKAAKTKNTKTINGRNPLMPLKLLIGISIKFEISNNAFRSKFIGFCNIQEITVEKTNDKNMITKLSLTNIPTTSLSFAPKQLKIDDSFLSSLYEEFLESSLS